VALKSASVRVSVNMKSSTTPAHPDAEDLGRFIECTIDEPTLTDIVEHIADCDDCRIVVADLVNSEGDWDES
jgi:hypothetical protein